MLPINLQLFRMFRKILHYLNSSSESERYQLKPHSKASKKSYVPNRNQPSVHALYSSADARANFENAEKRMRNCLKRFTRDKQQAA